MPSSGPDDGRAWLQVGAGALKHCAASGMHPEATLLFWAVQTRDAEACGQQINTCGGHGRVEH
jgi:hypothetical protein